MIDMLLSEERKMFRDTVRRFAETQMMPFVKEWEKQRKYPPEYYRRLSEMGFMGLMVPEKYGGMGRFSGRCCDSRRGDGKSGRVDSLNPYFCLLQSDISSWERGPEATTLATYSKR
jgi:hypothetical protein